MAQGMNIMPLLLLGGAAFLAYEWLSTSAPTTTPLTSNTGSTQSPVTTNMVNNGGPNVTQTITPPPALPQGVQTAQPLINGSPNLMYMPISGTIQTGGGAETIDGTVRLIA